MAEMFESLGLDITKAPMDIALNLLNILLLYFIVRMLVYKPVKKFLDGRSARVAAAIDAASAKEAEAERMKTEYQSLIDNAEAEKENILAEAQKKAKEEADMIISAAKKEAEKHMEASRAAAEEERRQTLASMKGEVADIAVAISRKLLEREINDGDSRRIADDFFKTAEKKAE